MTEKIYIGRVRDNNKNKIIAGEKLFIEKHSWDCGWYWGFGYIGNRGLHTHFEEFDYEPASKVFDDYVFSDEDWYCILDLFKQAYALKNAAEVYQYGGHITSNKDISGIITNKEMETVLNMDLQTVLDKVWSLMLERRKKVI